jgi:hypothetical protein
LLPLSLVPWKRYLFAESQKDRSTPNHHFSNINLATHQYLECYPSQSLPLIYPNNVSDQVYATQKSEVSFIMAGVNPLILSQSGKEVFVPMTPAMSLLVNLKDFLAIGFVRNHCFDFGLWKGFKTHACITKAWSSSSTWIFSSRSGISLSAPSRSLTCPAVRGKPVGL